MPILLQINTVCNSGSTGRIAEEIANFVIQKGWKSYIAYGRGKQLSASITYHIGRDQDLLINAFAARLFDNDGFVTKTYGTACRIYKRNKAGYNTLS